MGGLLSIRHLLCCRLLRLQLETLNLLGARTGVRASTESSESLPRDAVQAEVQRQLVGVMDQL